eukprot:ctg_6029.g492
MAVALDVLVDAGRLFDVGVGDADVR